MTQQATLTRAPKRTERKPNPRKAEPRSFLEFLLTDPECFALTKATSTQRGICRCLDGVPLGELVDDEDVRWAFTGKRGDEALEILAKLPVGVLPAEVILCAAIRGAKTLLSAALAYKACLTVDISPTRPNEVIKYSIAATTIGKARAAIRHLQGSIPNARRLRPYFLRTTLSGVVVRHPSGRPIEIEVVFAGGGGRGVISDWSAGLTADEAARMASDGKMVNLSDLLRAIQARLLPGAQVFMPGSPWAPIGLVFDAVQDQWGYPNRARVVVRATGPMLNPSWWTPQKIEEERAKINGELVVQTDCWAEFGSLPSQFFTAEDIKRATRPFQVDGIAQSELLYDPNRNYAAFMDPATRGNAWTWVIVSCLEGDKDSDTVFQVVHADEEIGTKQDPLQAKEIFPKIRAALERYRLSEIWSDQHNFDPNKEHAADCGITLLKDEATKAEKDNRYLEYRDLVIGDAPEGQGQPKRISLPPNPVFRADMLAIVKQLTRTGLSFPLPISPDGRHADYAPAVTGAVWAAKNATGGIGVMMGRARRRGFFVG
jgi:hypothetical protein